MGKKNNPGIIWDDDEYEARQKKYKKKDKPKKGIQEEFDLSVWEQNKQKTNNRRENKYKDKEKYDRFEDKWN